MTHLSEVTSPTSFHRLKRVLNSAGSPPSITLIMILMMMDWIGQNGLDWSKHRDWNDDDNKQNNANNEFSPGNVCTRLQPLGFYETLDNTVSEENTLGHIKFDTYRLILFVNFFHDMAKFTDIFCDLCICHHHNHNHDFGTWAFLIASLLSPSLALFPIQTQIPKLPLSYNENDAEDDDDDYQRLSGTGAKYLCRNGISGSCL